MDVLGLCPKKKMELFGKEFWRHTPIYVEEKTMTNEVIGLQEVANALGLPYYRVIYALKSGQVPDVKVRVGTRRVFQPDDVRRLAKHFGVALKEANAK